MDGFVDIHSHLLPGIDDGPEDLDGALEIARGRPGSATRQLAEQLRRLGWVHVIVAASPAPAIEAQRRGFWRRRWGLS